MEQLVGGCILAEFELRLTGANKNQILVPRDWNMLRKNSEGMSSSGTSHFESQCLVNGMTRQREMALF